MGFGDFESICRKSALPLCSIVGPPSSITTGGTSVVGIQANCYARSVELANTIIFEAANDFMHILALCMTAIMVLHVRSKFTAVGKHSPIFCRPPFFLSHHTTTPLLEPWPWVWILLPFFRPQRDNYILLHLHSAHHDFIDPGLWRHPPWIRCLPVLYRRAKWFYIRIMHLPPHQWLRRISAVWGWHNPICVASSGVFSCHVLCLRRRLDIDIQRQIGRSYQHARPVCCALSHQRHIPICLYRDASHPRHKHATRSMAAWWYFLRRFLLRDRTGYLVCLQWDDLQQRATLPWRIVFCYDMQPPRSNDGVQGMCPKKEKYWIVNYFFC